MPIVENITFQPLRIAVLTLSDSRDLSQDTSGDLLCQRLQDAGHILACRDLLPDDYQTLCDKLREWVADKDIQVILTTGGTGITARDITPEALCAVIDKEIPGFGELFRMLSYQKIATSTIQSRAMAGIAGKSLIFALPGSPGACKDAWDDILQYQLDIRHKPCNFTELLPRL